MRIIICGAGKIGMTLAQQLTKEGHDLTIIDLRRTTLETAQERFDAMTLCGNCAYRTTLLDAGIREADLLIAVTGADETNLLTCMTAHGLNKNLHTIARVRDPEYSEQVMAMRHIFPLSLTVNPERRTAQEIERLLKYPGFLRRDTFAKGRSEIVELRVEADSILRDTSLWDLNSKLGCQFLVCAVLRAGTAITPKGNFVLQEGDRIFVTAPKQQLTRLLKKLGILTRRVRNALLCGGGRVSRYLAGFLAADGIAVTILEIDPDRCRELSELLPEASVIQGNCTDKSTLENQGIREYDALVTLTGQDETNMVISLYGDSCGVPQIITKLSHRENNAIADAMNLGSMVSPRDLCANNIVRYVRAMENQTGAAISVHTIADGQVEAVEFLADETTKNRGIPLRELKLKPDVLVASITRGSRTQFGSGDSTIEAGDTVVVVTGKRGSLQQLGDIFA
ncbi:MAG: Trk system potassium transporter TrkA [Ruminococcaceae bacterium]|nr:Trk system potassium transporter TrkA [Oscillospiraceae bacterium]